MRYDRTSKDEFLLSYLLVSVLIWICQDHQWADVNGDGLVDFLWVDKFSGDTLVREEYVFIGSTPSNLTCFLRYGKCWANAQRHPDRWLLIPMDATEALVMRSEDRGVEFIIFDTCILEH